LLKEEGNFLSSPKGTLNNVNLFYLKDKLLENYTIHEKYEALSIVF